MSEDRTPPLPGQVLMTVPKLDEYEGIDAFEAGHIDDAHVTTSRVADSSNHKLVIDLDWPAKLIPSSTPGHFHLYVDKEIGQSDYFRLLDALEKAGLIQSGYLGASLERGYTAVRLPWVKKKAVAA